MTSVFTALNWGPALKATALKRDPQLSRDSINSKVHTLLDKVVTSVFTALNWDPAPKGIYRTNADRERVVICQGIALMRHYRLYIATYFNQGEFSPYLRRKS